MSDAGLPLQQQRSAGMPTTQAMNGSDRDPHDPGVREMLQDILRRPAAFQPTLSISANGPGCDTSRFPCIPLESSTSFPIEQLDVPESFAGSPGSNVCFLTYPMTPLPQDMSHMPPTVGTLSHIPVFTTAANAPETPGAAAPAAMQHWPHRQQQLQRTRELLAAVEAQHAHHHPAVTAADRALVAAMRAAAAAEAAAAASEQAAVAAERALYRAICELQGNQHTPS